ncbi:MAG: hypothetical protein HY304_07600 [candidate division Zixibacteria bacterium]|nr:hypothetical protein [candidate division Zixibacteria bacterium]
MVVPSEAKIADSAGPGLGNELLRWRSHPVKAGGRRLVWVIAVTGGMTLMLTILYGAFYGFLAILILGGSLGTYFLPTDYVLYEGGVESRFIGVGRTFAWGRFRSFYRDRHGVLLSPFLLPSRLENFRGIFLRFDGRGDQVMALVERHILPPTGDDAPDVTSKLQAE